MQNLFWVLVFLTVITGLAVLAVVLRYAVTGSFDREIGVPLFALAGSLVTATVTLSGANKSRGEEAARPPPNEGEQNGRS